jgi:hypothetical protein
MLGKNAHPYLHINHVSIYVYRYFINIPNVNGSNAFPDSFTDRKESSMISNHHGTVKPALVTPAFRDHLYSKTIGPHPKRFCKDSIMVSNYVQ